MRVASRTWVSKSLRLRHKDRKGSNTVNVFSLEDSMPNTTHQAMNGLAMRLSPSKTQKGHRAGAAAMRSGLSDVPFAQGSLRRRLPVLSLHRRSQEPDAGIVSRTMAPCCPGDVVTSNVLCIAVRRSYCHSGCDCGTASAPQRNRLRR